MNLGDIVYENENGKAIYAFVKSKKPMYRITRNDGHELWTNSMDIVTDFLKSHKQKTNQLELF